MPRPETPALTVDIIIALRDRPGRPIVLIERAHPPEGWALPGGFVDVGETVEHAAVREAREETGLNVELKGLLGCYSAPERDPRGHTASLVYMAEAEGEPQGQDDAKDAAVFVPDRIGVPLAFDHALILEDYRRYLFTGEPAPLRVS